MTAVVRRLAVLIVAGLAALVVSLGVSYALSQFVSTPGSSVSVSDLAGNGWGIAAESSADNDGNGWA